MHQVAPRSRELELTSATLLLYACKVDLKIPRALEASKRVVPEIYFEIIASCNLSTNEYSHEHNKLNKLHIYIFLQTFEEQVHCRI